MSVIAVMNQKGGCGKTTTSTNLSAALAYQGKNVLLVDFDPQGHSSLGLGLEESKLKYSIYNVLMENVPLETAIVNPYKTLSLLPCNISLASLEQKLSGVDGREYYLRNLLNSVRSQYDTIIIDCPPHLGLLSVNALLASDCIIIPVEPSKFGLDGLQKLNQTIDTLCKKVDHQLQRKYLLSLFDIDSEFSLSFAKRMQRDFSENLFETRIHRSSVIREAVNAGMPVVEFDEHSVSYMDFLSLAHEVIIWQSSEILQELANAQDLAPKKTDLGVCFMVKAPKARSVQVAGTFNNFNPENTPMIKLKQKDLWYAFLPLKDGKYSYQYVVDGNYTVDPENPHMETSLFGVSQSVVQVQ